MTASSPTSFTRANTSTCMSVIALSPDTIGTLSGEGVSSPGSIHDPSFPTTHFTHNMTTKTDKNSTEVV